MDRAELRRAHNLDKEIGQLEDLREEVSVREVTFTQGDRIRDIGRMQLSEGQIKELKDHLKQSTREWFDNLINKKIAELKELGVDHNVSS